MLIDIDSDEFTKSKTNQDKHDAISYVIDINSILPTTLPPHRYAIAAYFLFRARKMGLSLEEISNRPLFPIEKPNLFGTPIFSPENTEQEIIDLGKKYLTSETWLKIAEYSQGKSDKIFENTAIFAPRPSTLGKEIITPPSLVELGKQILNIQNGENVADLCCGTGQFITLSGQDTPNANYTGIEITPEKYAIAKIKTQMLKELNGTKSEIIKCDIFENYLNNKDKKYNKIFSNYPFGPRIQELEPAESIKKYIESSPENIKLFSENKSSSDWLFNKLIYDSLAENGKAVALMTTGSAVNMTDEHVRKYFVDNGMIEAVINLPEKLFAETAIATTIIVLGHNTSGKIKIINGTKIFSSGRRLNYLSEENIEKIMHKLNKKDSHYLTQQDIAGNHYKLKLIEEQEKHLPRFSEKDTPYVTLEEVLSPEGITRGAHFDASELDKMASEPSENKNDSFLQLKDVQDGILGDDLTKINIETIYSERATKSKSGSQSFAEMYQKYLIKDSSIVLSKNGLPFKVAFVSVPDGEKILASGNFYILNVDKNSKVDPKFIAAYFTSSQGQQALKNLATGTVMATISISNLKKIKIPCPDKTTQINIIKTYRKKQTEIIEYRSNLKKANSDIKHLFDLKEDE